VTITGDILGTIFQSFFIFFFLNCYRVFKSIKVKFFNNMEEGEGGGETLCARRFVED